MSGTPKRLEHPHGAGTAGDPGLITPALLRSWQLPNPSGAKSARGQVLVVGGARKTPGAVLLAAEAALRVGAGRLGMGAPVSVAVPMAVALREAGVVGLPEDDAGSVTGQRAADLLRDEVERADAVLVGPGLDTAEGAVAILEALVPLLKKSTQVVLDAYGFTVLPELRPATAELLKGRIAAHCNAAELAHILDEDSIDEDDEFARGLLTVARRFGAVVTSQEWVVSEDGAVWRLTAGDTGLGTSGSGDVLAGTMAGLLARGADRDQATAWAVHLHSTAGENLSGQMGRIGYLASELLSQLPVVMSRLQGD